MASAKSESSRFGSGEAEIRVSKPLTLLPNFPRFLSISDTATFGAGRAPILAPFLAEGTAVMLEGQGGFALRRPFGRGSVLKS